MKYLFHVCALMLMLAAPAVAREMPNPDVNAAISQWKAAVESGSADAIMKLYDNSAIMISTFAQNPMTKRADIYSYYKKVVENPDIKVEISETHPRTVGNNVAVNTGRYTLSYKQDGEPVVIPARFSFVYELKEGRWMIIDHHSSRVPMADGDK